MEFNPSSIGAVAVDDYQPKGFDPSSIGAIPVEEFDPKSLGAVAVEEAKPDTLADDWSGFVANMQIAGNRLGQGMAVAGIEEVSRIKSNAEKLSQKAQRFGTPEQDPKDYSNVEYMASRGANAPEGSLPRRKFEEEKRRLEDQAGTELQRFQRAAGELPSFAEYISKKEKRIQELTPQLSPEMTKLNESEDSEFWKTFASNPVESLANVIGSSAIIGAPAIALGAIGSTAGPMGTAAGSAYGSYITETSQSLLDSLKGSGVDLSDPEKFQEGLNNPIIMERARQVAETRGVAVATFDALTAGLAGRFIGPVLKSNPTVKSALSATAKEVATQMTGGAAGELAAQIASAQDVSGKDIALEALGEIGSGITETIGNVRSTNQILAETAASTPPPPATVPTPEAQPTGTTVETTAQTPIEETPPPVETPVEETAPIEETPVEPTPEPTDAVPQQQEGPTPEEPPKVLTSDERAAALQPHLKAAQAAAAASGATDPEDAAQVAWIKVSNSEKPLDNPRAVLIDAARSEAKSQLSKAKAQKRGGGNVESLDVDEMEGAAVQTRGPRAEAVSKEDMEGIAKAIGTLNENEQRVARVLMRGEDLSNQEIADELDLAVGTVKNIKMKIEETFRPYAERMGFGQSLGPGAASAAEVLTRYEVRRFSERFQKSEDIDPEIREQTGDRFYEPLPNQVTAAKAREFFEKVPDSETALSQVMDEREPVSFADRAAIGQLLVKKINQEYKSLKNTDPEKANRLMDRVIQASEWLADYGTRLGQGVQAFAMWNRLTPEGKLRSVQREVQKTRKKFVKDNQKDIDEVHDILNEDTSMEVKRSKLSKSKSKTAKAAKKNLNKIPKKPTKEQLLDALSKDLGLPALTPEQQAEIMRLAEIADNAAEGMPKEDALKELNSYIARIKGFQWSDLPLGIYYGNILSGAGTQVVNLVDTALNVLNESVSLAVAGNEGRKSIQDLFQIIGGLAKGLDTGRFDAMLAITKGRRISDGKFVETPFLMDVAEFGKEGGVPITETGPIASFAKRAAEKKGAKYLNAYKYVGRVMAASDSLIFRSAQEARAAQLAHWLAYDSGLKGADLRAEVDRILGFDRKEEFLSQAEAEGYTGVQAKARATELMIMSRPEELQKEATDFASEATYNYKPYGLAGAMSNSVEAFSRKYPAFKLIVPFTRIVANVFNRGINNTPFGAIRALRGKSGDKVFSEREREMLIARATVGTLALTSIAALHAAGLVTLHGQGPEDEEKRKQLRQTGWKPYSIQIGNDYYTYTYTPFGLGLAAMANSIDASRYGSMSQKDWSTRTAFVFQSILSTLFSQHFLSGVSSLFEALSTRSGSALAAVKRMASSTASGLAVPFSSAVKDINQAFDPSVRKPESVAQAVISEIPIARTLIKPAINALGEEIQKDRFRVRERFYSEAKSEGPWKLVAEKGLRVPVTGPFFENPEEDYEYAKKTGERIKTFLENNEDMLRSLPQKVAQDSLENFADRVKKEVRGEMLYKGAKKKPKK